MSHNGADALAACDLISDDGLMSAQCARLCIARSLNALCSSSVTGNALTRRGELVRQLSNMDAAIVSRNLDPLPVEASEILHATLSMAADEVARSGAGGEAIGLALWTSRAEAKAGIRAARTLGQVYTDVLREHPDAVKYGPQVRPILDAADKWDNAWVFFTDAEALEIGRRAQALSQQISAAYDRPPIQLDKTLEFGVVEQAQQTAKKGIDPSSWSIPWWVWGGGALALGGAALYLVAPAVLTTFARRRFA